MTLSYCKETFAKEEEIRRNKLRLNSFLFAQHFMQNYLGIQVGDCVRSIDLERMLDQLAKSLFDYRTKEEPNAWI